MPTVTAPAPNVLTDLTIRVLPGLSGVPAAEWDSCANPEPQDQDLKVSNQKPQSVAEDKCGLRGYRYNPFISYDFLSALEASLSVTARTGWQPQHLVVED